MHALVTRPLAHHSLRKSKLGLKQGQGKNTFIRLLSPLVGISLPVYIIQKGTVYHKALVESCCEVVFMDRGCMERMASYNTC